MNTTKYHGDDRVEILSWEAAHWARAALDAVNVYRVRRGAGIDPDLQKAIELADTTGREYRSWDPGQDASRAVIAQLTRWESTLRNSGPDDVVVYRLDLENCDWAHHGGLLARAEDLLPFATGLIGKYGRIEAPAVLPVNEREAVLQMLQRALAAAGYFFLERGGNSGWICHDIWVVAMDETEYYEIPEEWADKIERIKSVYFFDKNAITHLCSTTGSYWLEHLESRAVFKAGVEEALGADAYERFRDRVDGWVQTGDDASDYRDEYDMEKFIERHAAERWRVHHYGNPGLDLVEALEAVESDERFRQKYKHNRTAEEIEKIVAESHADGTFEEQVRNRIMDAVREGLQSNSVI